MTDYTTIAHDTATDWDSHQSQSRVVHEATGDYSAGDVQLGYPVRQRDLAYWHFHDGGSPAQEMVNGHSASVETGTPSWGNAGILNTTAIDFSASSHLTAGSQAPWDFAAGEGFSVSFWAYFNSNYVSSGNLHGIFGNGGGWSNEGFCMFYDDSTSRDLRWELQDSAGNRYAYDIVDGGLPMDQWVHITGVHPNGGGDGVCYVNGSNADGTLAASGPVDQSITGVYDLELGHVISDDSSGPGYEFPGRISSIKIIGDGLTSTEVQGLVDCASSGTLTTPKVVS